MFTPKQLDQLEQLLEDEMIHHHVEEIVGGADNLRALIGAVQSAIWNSSRQLSHADRQRIKAAEREGKVSVYERAQSSVPTTGGWTMASQIEARRAKLVSPVVQAGTGDDLLEALGL